MGGGGSGSPQEKFWKTDANGAFWANFCRVRVDFPPKIVCNFSKIRSPSCPWCGRFFSFRMGGGVPLVFYFFFFDIRIQMIHSESIHSRLLVGIFFFFFFWNFTFVMKAPSCRWEFTGIIWEELVFFLCRKDPGGNTAPPPHPLQIFWKIDAICTRDDFSRLNFCILSKGIFF